MKTDLPLVARTILEELIDRWEQPARQRVVRVRLNERDHAAYFSAHAVSMRRETNNVLQQFAAQDLVRLRWRKWEEHNWLDAIDLVPESADAVYALLQRTPIFSRGRAGNSTHIVLSRRSISMRRARIKTCCVLLPRSLTCPRRCWSAN